MPLASSCSRSLEREEASEEEKRDRSAEKRKRDWSDAQSFFCFGFFFIFVFLSFFFLSSLTPPPPPFLHHHYRSLSPLSHLFLRKILSSIFFTIETKN